MNDEIKLNIDMLFQQREPDRAKSDINYKKKEKRIERHQQTETGKKERDRFR